MYFARLKRSCTYPYSGSQTEIELRARIRELEARLSSQSDTQLSAPLDSQSYYNVISSCISRTVTTESIHFQKLFLNSDLRIAPRAQFLALDIRMPATVRNHVEDQSQRALIISQYFQTAYNWIPIVSKFRLESLSRLQPHPNLRPDYILLLLSMELLQQVHQDTLGAMRDSLYTSIKVLSNSLEMAGAHSVLKLQANFLVAVYEMGHGIFLRHT